MLILMIVALEIWGSHLKELKIMKTMEVWQEAMAVELFLVTVLPKKETQNLKYKT